MRVAPPASFRLDAASLLTDLRDRLGARDARFRDSDPDPSDPAWILVEQCAHVVSMLSAQLDEYPFAVLRQFTHLLGVDRHPARPAIGVVAVGPRAHGTLTLTPGEPAPYKLLSAQTETRDIIEFEPMEPQVPLVEGRIVGVWAIRDGELHDCPGPGNVGGLHCVPGVAARSQAFASERIEWRVVGADADALVERLRKAADALVHRPLPWLAIAVEALSATEACVTATVPIERAFGLGVDEPAPGGDLLGQLGALDGSLWTPPIVLRAHGALPARSLALLPGDHEGSVVLSGLPAQWTLSSVVQRRAEPIPPSAIEAIWVNLVAQDTALIPLRPSTRRRIEDPGDGSVPVWLDALLRGPGWSAIGTADAHLVYVEVAAGAPTVRLSLLVDPERAEPRIAAWALVEGVLGSQTLPARGVWELPCPPHPADPDSRLRLLRTFDFTLPRAATGVLVSVSGPIHGALLNPLLTMNAPAVRDGRVVRVERAVPESVTLDFEHLVTRDVLAQLAEAASPSVGPLVTALAVARFGVEGQPPIADYEGVAVDAMQGQLVLGAPDDRGFTRALRPGTEVELAWYRRTDGAAGNVEAGAVQFVEQHPRAEPVILTVVSPLACWGGSDAESEDDCMARVFGGTVGTPLLAVDWEREMARALGERSRDLLIRCWSHAERSLGTTWIWPLDDFEGDPERRAFAEALVTAGPETLVFAVGPNRGRPSAALLDAARLAARGLVRNARRRGGAIRHVIVTGLWPLRLDGGAPLASPTSGVAELGGTLVDDLGRHAATPVHGLLLNAVVFAAAKETR